jgi:mmgE/prpD family protein
MKSYTQVLVDFAEKIKYEDLSDCTIEQTKIFIADYYAASLAGYQVNRDFNSVAMSIVREEGGTEEASILFEERKYPVSKAAFMNAVYAHGADMDDGNRKSAGHIGTHVISAVLAMSEKQNVTWKDIIVAINVGYEFFNRIAGAVQPGLYNKGFHSTGIAGAIASAAACAKVMGLDKAGIYNSVSLAAIQSSGLIIIDESGQNCKPINPANAARTGVISAMMAAKGVMSSRDPLESQKGWFHAFTDQVDEGVLLDGLGMDFTICESYLKLYPTCRHTHSCIDAALEIRNQISARNSLLCDAIKRIQVFVYPSAIKSAGTIQCPRSQEEAKFSIHYAIATALKKGGFSLEDLNLKNGDHTINELIKKIELVSDCSMENREKGVRGSRVKVMLRDGRFFEKTILIPKGEGAGSLTWNDMQTKMLACSQGIITVEIAELLMKKCRDIDINNRFNSILSFLTKNKITGKERK